MFHQIKNRRFLFFIAPFVLMTMLICPATGRQQTNTENMDQSSVGIPFESKEESYAVSVGRRWWHVKLILSRDYYFKENLEKIFKYYMKKYPDKRTALTVDVYADVQTYERYMNNRRERESLLESPSPQPKTRDTWASDHASFLRGCDNQFYYYSPDLENPAQRERVLLKGRFTMGPELRECSEPNK